MRVTRVLRCQPPSQIEDRGEAPRISGSAGEATRPKIVATQKIMKYFTIRTVLGIGTGNLSAVVSVVPSGRSSKRGALLGPKRHPKCQDRTSIGVFFNPGRKLEERAKLAPPQDYKGNPLHQPHDATCPAHPRMTSPNHTAIMASYAHTKLSPSPPSGHWMVICHMRHETAIPLLVRAPSGGGGGACADLSRGGSHWPPRRPPVGGEGDA